LLKHVFSEMHVYVSQLLNTIIHNVASYPVFVCSIADSVCLAHSFFYNFGHLANKVFSRLCGCGYIN